MLRSLLVQKINRRLGLSHHLVSRHKLRHPLVQHRHFLEARGLLSSPHRSNKARGGVPGILLSEQLLPFGAERVLQESSATTFEAVAENLPEPSVIVVPTLSGELQESTESLGEIAPGSKPGEKSSQMIVDKAKEPSRIVSEVLEPQLKEPPFQSARKKGQMIEELSPPVPKKSAPEDIQVMSSQSRLDIPDSQAAAEPSKAEELFTPQKSQARSPQEWAALLTQATQEIQQTTDKPPALAQGGLPSDGAPSDYRPTQVASMRVPIRTVAPKTKKPADQAEPLSQPTRRFLKPLLGIDAANVPLFRGTQAAQFAAANGADAVTDGESVVLGEGYESETPASMGVIAHELTHIARRQNPRFVPPVAHQRENIPSIYPSPENLDEETLALQVENRVRSLAQGSGVEETTPSAAAAPTESNLSASSAALAAPATAAPPWGGLPAPWEPLPAWMQASDEASPSSVSFSSELGNALAQRPALPVATNASEATAALQFAEQERSLVAPLPVNKAKDTTPDANQVAPDLDAMAQQVYSILKRRLAVEQRREMF